MFINDLRLGRIQFFCTSNATSSLAYAGLQCIQVKHWIFWCAYVVTSVYPSLVSKLKYALEILATFKMNARPQTRLFSPFVISCGCLHITQTSKRNHGSSISVWRGIVFGGGHSIANVPSNLYKFWGPRFPSFLPAFAQLLLANFRECCSKM